MIGGYRYVLVAGAVLLVVALSGWAGYRIARGECAAGELEVARAYAAHSDTLAEFARQQSEDAAQRVTAVRAGRATALSRVRELERELANLPRRPECDFSTGELQALRSLREAHEAGRRFELSPALRTDARTEQPAAGLHPTADGVGLRVQ